MKLTKGVMISTLFLVISLGLFGYFFNDYMKAKQESIVQKRIDDYLKDLLDRIKDRKNIILTAAVILSNDSDVKECLKDEKKESCVRHLLRIQNIFNDISFAHGMKIHVHTKDLKSFFRVWDLKDGSEDSLVLFRDSLGFIKDTKKEAAGIEIGRFSMLIRGISPILEGDKYLGSIEVISDFDSITKDLKKRDIDFYVLMHKKYEQIVTKVDYPIQRRVGKYIVVNSVNSELNSFRDIEFKDTGYKVTKNYYIIYTPIYDIMGEKIGFYVLKILKKKLL